MHWRKYLLTFAITAAIFFTAFYLAASINDRRIAEIRSIQENVALDILSIEAQFDLLGELDCRLLAENSVLSDQLNSLAERLAYTESNLGSNNAEVEQLKKQYSLLQIKDYILLQRVTQKCGRDTISILYFYTNVGDCTECRRTGEVLTYLRQTYPTLRVYAFDYNLELGALQTLIRLHNVKPELPALVINNRAPLYGFNNLEEMYELVPALRDLATSTPETTSAQE
jgi:uncharacterized protein YdcH (DUF465 family)